MKKVIFTLLAFVPAMFLSLSTVSCSSDDDNTTTTSGGDTDTEETSDVALYTFTDASSIFESLEFTESSRYIITRKSGSFSAKTRSYEGESMIIEGKYKKNGSVYILDGFGSVSVESQNGLQIVTITETGKTATKQTAKKNEPAKNVSDMTDKICRTWKVDETIDVKLITITQLGTYLLKYDDNTMDMARWRWSDESKGIVQYSWDFDGTSVNWNSKESGFLSVSFEGNKAVIKEVIDGEEYTYHLSELK